MNFEMTDYSIIDSTDDTFQAKVKFNYKDDQEYNHPGELMISHCPWSKDCIRKEDFLIDYVELTESMKRFEGDSLDFDLGYENIDMLKKQLEVYLKHVLKH